MYDIVIIGAGFAGLSAAYHYGRDGKRVLVLERHDGTQNASFASTAEMNHDPDADWDYVLRTFGIFGATALWQLTEKSLTLLDAFAHREGSEHFETKRVPAHMFAYGSLDRAPLEHKYELYKKMGAEVSLSREPRALHPSFTAVLTLTGDGRTNNQAILRTLARAIGAGGGRVVRNQDVVAVTPLHGGVEVTTKSGKTYAAHRALIATGDQTIAGLLPLPIQRHRTFVVRYETNTLDPLFKNAILWDVDEPFHYIRSFAGRQLWVGGEDVPESAVLPSTAAEAYARIDAYARDVLHLDASYEKTGAWDGTFFPSDRSLPFIADDPHAPISYSVGFGGSGLLMSFVSGYLHAAWARGEELHYKPFFSLT